MIAGIELGGSKTVVAIGSGQGTIIAQHRFPTHGPVETLSTAVAWLKARGTPAALGIAAFGPVGIVPSSPHYGRILNTPKTEWQNFHVIDFLITEFPQCRLVIETDVNAAALSESRLGAARNLDDVAYITIGTGIGAGILSGGRLIHGALHSEFGHLKVPRAPGDDFAGVCPFHQDCLEGLASGPAMALRWGIPAHELPSSHPAWEMEAWYLAHGILSLAAVVSPARVIIGGGISQAADFHEKVYTILQKVANGYFPPLLVPNYVVPPMLGQDAGICGALLLAGEML